MPFCALLLITYYASQGHLKNALLQVCALRVTERARARILKAGGQILTFDELAVRSPRGKNTVLMQGQCKPKSSGFDHDIDLSTVEI